MNLDIVNLQGNTENMALEDNMPFNRYIKDRNGDRWCYDKETKAVYRLILEKPVYTTIPQEVLIALLQADDAENKEVIQKNNGRHTDRQET
jgi:hypothetical protein